MTQNHPMTLGNDPAAEMEAIENAGSNANTRTGRQAHPGCVLPAGSCLAPLGIRFIDSYTPRGYIKKEEQLIRSRSEHEGDAELMTTEVLQVKGMSCNHCVNSVEGAVKEAGGSAKVDLAAGKVTVEFDEAKLSLQAIKEAIEEQGYDVV
jgi:copper chaperone